jgi:hypothetical protein
VLELFAASQIPINDFSLPRPETVNAGFVGLPSPIVFYPLDRGASSMQVIVRRNNVDQALKALK